MDNIPGNRQYDLDWLRFFAIVILLFYHTGMLFNNWGWHIKNTETSASFQYWMIWLHEWRMPLLLFISGAGTCMALSKRTAGQFTTERLKRLLVPLIFGMLIIVPPQVYVERYDDYCSYLEFYKSIFDFVPYPAGSFSWHHLWFIAYLFVFSILALPLLLFLRSERSMRFKEWIGQVLTIPATMVFIPSTFILITQILIRPYYPDATHALVNDWGYFAFYFCFFLFGMICYSQNNVWLSLAANRKHFLIVALASLIPFYLTFLHISDVYALPWTTDTVETIFDVTAIFMSWFTVITIIGYGQYYLNISHPWLRYINEGLYPFYILHQTVLVVIGYFVAQWSMTILYKYVIASLGTLMISILIYRMLIRPFGLTRFVFGVKLTQKGFIPVTEKEQTQHPLRINQQHPHV